MTGAPSGAWERISCGESAKGPRVYDWAAAKLPSVDGAESTHYRWVLARRSLARPEEIAYYLAFAPVGASIGELVRVAGARWAIEECFQAAKNERGLDQYEVRRYVGWYRHITLAMLAHAFLAAIAAHALEKGQQKRFEQPRCPHPGRNPTAPGPCPSPRNPAPVTHPSALLVPLALTSPGHRPPLPLPAPHAPRSGESRTSTHLMKRQPARLQKDPVNRTNEEARLEY
ncbi:hypothetical protein ACFWXZ_26255 [[Kitasatospora] papulosa]|uniref:hypothetical protein n=1 Tax=[Kitasatospora] papulosa TaxID=1464011 RepID=UPI0036C8B7A0